jgi:hypothetical protein
MPNKTKIFIFRNHHQIKNQPAMIRIGVEYIGLSSNVLFINGTATKLLSIFVSWRKIK